MEACLCQSNAHWWCQITHHMCHTNRVTSSGIRPEFFYNLGFVYDPMRRPDAKMSLHAFQLSLPACAPSMMPLDRSEVTNL